MIWWGIGILQLLICAYWAQNKGRGWKRWAFFGLFVPFVPLICLALCGDLKKCQSCYKSIPKEAKVCFYCRTQQYGEKVDK